MYDKGRRNPPRAGHRKIAQPRALQDLLVSFASAIPDRALLRSHRSGICGRERTQALDLRIQPLHPMHTPVTGDIPQCWIVQQRRHYILFQQSHHVVEAGHPHQTTGSGALVLAPRANFIVHQKRLLLPPLLPLPLPRRLLAEGTGQRPSYVQYDTGRKGLSNSSRTWEDPQAVQSLHQGTLFIIEPGNKAQWGRDRSQLRID